MIAMVIKISIKLRAKSLFLDWEFERDTHCTHTHKYRFGQNEETTAI